MISASSTIAATPDQVSADLSGEAVILNLKDGVYYGLDPIGARIWELIQQPASVGRLRDALLEEYEVEPAVAEADIKPLLSDMKSHGLIEVVS